MKIYTSQELRPQKTSIPRSNISLKKVTWTSLMSSMLSLTCSHVTSWPYCSSLLLKVTFVGTDGQLLHQQLLIFILHHQKGIQLIPQCWLVTENRSQLTLCCWFQCLARHPPCRSLARFNRRCERKKKYFKKKKKNRPSIVYFSFQCKNFLPSFILFVLEHQPYFCT